MQSGASATAQRLRRGGVIKERGCRRNCPQSFPWLLLDPNRRNRRAPSPVPRYSCRGSFGCPAAGGLQYDEVVWATQRDERVDLLAFADRRFRRPPSRQSRRAAGTAPPHMLASQRGPRCRSPQARIGLSSAYTSMEERDDLHAINAPYSAHSAGRPAGRTPLNRRPRLHRDRASRPTMCRTRQHEGRWPFPVPARSRRHTLYAVARLIQKRPYRGRAAPRLP